MQRITNQFYVLPIYENKMYNAPSHACQLPFNFVSTRVFKHFYGWAHFHPDCCVGHLPLLCKYIPGELEQLTPEGCLYSSLWSFYWRSAAGNKEEKPEQHNLFTCLWSTKRFTDRVGLTHQARKPLIVPQLWVFSSSYIGGKRRAEVMCQWCLSRDLSMSGKESSSL